MVEHRCCSLPYYYQIKYHVNLLGGGGGGKDEQQGIIQGIALKWWAKVHQPPELWGWQGLGHMLFTRLQGPALGWGEKSLSGQNRCNVFLASV